MNTPMLAMWLAAGGAAWLAAGRVATGSLRLETSPYWAAPMVAGAAAVTVLAQLDTSVPAFAHVATRAGVFWVIAAGVYATSAVVGVGMWVALRWPLAVAALGIQAVAIATGSGAAEQISLPMPVVGSVVVSELVRVLLVLATAGVVTRLEPILDHRLRGGALRPLVAVGGCWILSALMSFAAKDTGAAASTLLVLAITALFVLGRPTPTLAILGAGVAGMAVAAIVFPHAVRRITMWASPPTGSEIDQARMALYASSSGRLTGNAAGGQGLQYVGSTLDDDFLLAAVGRVLGFAGVVAVIGLVVAAAIACLRPLESPGPYGFRRWVSVSAAALIATQLVLSAGGVYGLLPATGVPVPFMTGSGASLVAISSLMGIAAAAQRTTRHAQGEAPR